jgi:hypothetical protein
MAHHLDSALTDSSEVYMDRRFFSTIHSISFLFQTYPDRVAHLEKELNLSKIQLHKPVSSLWSSFTHTLVSTIDLYEPLMNALAVPYDYDDFGGVMLASGIQ